ncbi:MAG TPA: hypothetical protein VD908_13995 [Cytophagales bacterium]|nr:hypothetical protein [Cytophagales bacterium]
MNKILTLVLIFFSLVSLAQKPKGKTNQSASTTLADTIKADVAYQTEINLLARYYGDSIVLRWAPGTPGGWTNANKAGYIISRTTLDVNGEFDPATFKNLNSEPIKPWPLEKWETIAGEKNSNNYAKIAAQALYGKSFVPSTGFIDKADDYMSRYSFSMLAADISSETATALGLRFTDKSIEKNKVYIYRITSPVDTTKYKLIPGFIVVDTEKPEILPKASISDTKELQNLIEIYWDRELHSKVFSAYWIERSEDGGTSFKKLNKVPFINPVDEKNPRSIDYIIYSDSIPKNYKTYKYRVIGITAFGELAPPSDPVSVMGRDTTPPPVPGNLKTVAIGGSKVKITWDYPKDVKDLKGFLIGRGNNPAEQFTPLVTELLPSKSREFIDNNASEERSNYYIVAAVDTAGNANLSLAKYALMVDSIPPAAPTYLQGKIDTTGVVKVSWRLGPEKDILGYQVYFSNQKDHQFSQLTNGPIQDTVFTDTITIKTLTKKIYYRVVAIDLSHNYSGFSEMLELKKPDIVPPSPAIFDKYKVTNEGINVSWMPSSSEDLARTILYRKEEKGDWAELVSFGVKDKKTSYMDTKVESGKFYSYSLIAEDEDKLRSKRSLPIKLKYLDLKAKPLVNQVVAKPDMEKGLIKINWEYPVKGEYRFVIYRAVNGSNFVSYKSIDSGNLIFDDKDVRKGNTYEYTINVIFKDGRKSGFGGIAKAQL